jgi:hypothetical protein
LGDQRGIATCIERLAQLAAATGRTERAAWLWGAAEARREAIGLGLRHDESADRARLMAVAVNAISETDFTQARLQGRDATIHGAVELALQNWDDYNRPSAATAEDMARERGLHRRGTSRD